MVLVGIERACPPAAAVTLVGQQPFDAAPDARIPGIHAGLAQDDERQSGLMSVTRRNGELSLRSQLLGSTAIAPRLSSYE